MTTGDVVYSLRFSLIKILPEPGFDLGSTAGESCVLTARLHMLHPVVKKIVTHHVWRTIPPRFELYPCSENPVETSISLYQLSDLYPYTNHAP